MADGRGCGVILKILGLVSKRTSDDGWHHSIFDSVKPEQLTEKKFRVEVRFGRYREDVLTENIAPSI